MYSGLAPPSPPWYDRVPGRADGEEQAVNWLIIISALAGILHAVIAAIDFVLDHRAEIEAIQLWMIAGA